MIRIFAYILMLLFCATGTASVPKVDFAFSFTGGDDKEVITTTIMDASSFGNRGDGGWASDPENAPWGTTNIFLCNTQLFSFPGGYVCGSNLFAGGMSARYDFSTASFFNFWYGEDREDLSGFFFFMMDVPPGNNNGFDIFTIQSWDGGYGLIQWYNSDPPYIHPHNSGASKITVASGTPYYCTWQWITGGNFIASFYNATNWAYIGSVTNTTSIETHGANVFSFGCNTHGYESATYHLYYGDWGFAWNSTAWPILPNRGQSIDYSNIIPNERRITWQGNVGVPGGIANRSTIWTNVTGIDNTGSSDVASAIQHCLDNCPAGQVIYIPAGTYKVNSPLVIKDSYTVRGAGPSQTIISGFGDGTGIVQFGAFDSTSSGGIYYSAYAYTSATSASGATKGATQITVGSASGITNGALMCIDETNNPAYVDMRCTSDNDLAYNGCGSRTANFTRLAGQIVCVTNVSGTTISFEPPLFLDFTNAAQVVMSRCYIRYAGLEDLKLYANDSGYNGNVWMAGAYGCWAKNIEGDYADGNQVSMVSCVRCEIRDSYFHDGFAHTAGQTDDCILLRGHSTGCLIENNILRRLHIGVMVEHGGGGHVIAYNYSTNNFDSGGTNTVFSDYDYHGAHVAHVLWEGNWGSKFNQDGGWGSASHGTVFRCYFAGDNWSWPPWTGRGAEQAGTPQHQYYGVIGIQLMFNSSYFNVVGSVVGGGCINPDYLNGVSGSSLPGYTQVSWPIDAEGAGYGSAACYMLNYALSSSPYDSTVPLNTLLRHGNWDGVSRVQAWDGAIINHTLPNSLYLTGKPAFFGSLDWPPVNPATGTTNLTAMTLPAGYRYLNGTNPPSGEGTAAPAVTLRANTVTVRGTVSTR